MPSEQFTHGFRHELANRSFALRCTEVIVGHLHGDPRHAFWESYAELERFNAPRYAQAADRWGLNTQPSIWTRLRGATAGAAPKPRLTPLLKFAYPTTVAYLEELHRLRSIGTRDGKAFLDYMVNQEALQVEVLQLALTTRYQEAATRVDEFLAKHRHPPLF